MWLSALTTAEPASRPATISLLVVSFSNAVSTPSLAGQQRGIDVSKAVHRYREHHDARVRDRVAGPPRLRAGDDQLGDQRDVLRVARRGDGHRVAGAHGQPRDDGPDVTRAEHREPALVLHGQQNGLYPAYIPPAVSDPRVRPSRV